MRLRRLLALLLPLLLLGSGTGPASACTSVIVGRQATADGSIYIARSDDTKVQSFRCFQGCFFEPACSRAGSLQLLRCRPLHCPHHPTHRTWLPPTEVLPHPAPCPQQLAPPFPSPQNAIITNNLLYHPPRDGPAAFTGSVNNFSITLPPGGLSYIAVPKWYSWSTWPQVQDMHGTCAVPCSMP